MEVRLNDTKQSTTQFNQEKRFNGTHNTIVYRTIKYFALNFDRFHRTYMKFSYKKHDENSFRLIFSK